MNIDNVIEFTRALVICELTSKPKQDIYYSLTIDEMLRFANLVAEHERERYATLCDELDKKYWQETGELMSGYGDAIREMDRS